MLKMTNLEFFHLEIHHEHLINQEEKDKIMNIKVLERLLIDLTMESPQEECYYQEINLCYMVHF